MNKDDRYPLGCFSQGCCRLRAAAYNHLRIQSHQAGCVGSETVVISSGPAIFNLDILAIDPAESLKTFAKRAYVGLLVRASYDKGSDPPRRSPLLRARGIRPDDGHPAQTDDELASLHARPQAQETASYRLKRVPDRG